MRPKHLHSVSFVFVALPVSRKLRDTGLLEQSASVFGFRRYLINLHCLALSGPFGKQLALPTCSVCSSFDWGNLGNRGTAAEELGGGGLAAYRVGQAGDRS